MGKTSYDEAKLLLDNLRLVLLHFHPDYEQNWLQTQAQLSYEPQVALAKLLEFVKEEIIEPRIKSWMHGGYNKFDTDDIVEETWIQVDKIIPKLLKLPSPGPYINRIADNKLKDFYGTQKRKKTVQLSEELAGATSLGVTRIEYEVNKQQKLNELAERHCPKNKNKRERRVQIYKIILKGKFEEGYTFSEIGKQLKEAGLAPKGSRKTVEKYWRELKKDLGL